MMTTMPKTMVETSSFCSSFRIRLLLLIICLNVELLKCDGDELGSRYPETVANETPYFTDEEDGEGEGSDRRRVLQYYANMADYESTQTDDGDSRNRRILSSTEYRLYSKLLLLSNYSKNVRPVRNHLDPIVVKVGMCVMMIEDLIERDQTMVISACIKFFWVDEYLRWDPLHYGNLTWLALGSHSIWLPDIAIVNSPEPHALTKKPTNIGVSHRGEVGFFPSGRLATRCNLIITYFPFDWQNCEVRFESWIYPTKYLIVELYPGEEPIDVKEYYDNYQWSLKSYRVETDVVNYDAKNFSSLTVVFRLRRKPAFYFMYYIFPELLLSALQTLSHTLPVEHPGRMAMLTALFIGTSVTHAGIATHIPKSSDTMSLLQIYMTIMSVNLVLALLVTFVMLYTVLRYPKHREPSFGSMMAAFFQIVWPAADDSDFLFELNRHFVNKSLGNMSKKERRHRRNKEKFSKTEESELLLLTSRITDNSLKIIREDDDYCGSYNNNNNNNYWHPSSVVNSSASTPSTEHAFPNIVHNNNSSEEEPIWQPNPDYCLHCKVASGSECENGGCFDGFMDQHKPNYDCAYYRAAREEILPVIPPIPSAVANVYGCDNPGFVLPVKYCNMCHHHQENKGLPSKFSKQNADPTMQQRRFCRNLKLRCDHVDSEDPRIKRKIQKQLTANRFENHQLYPGSLPRRKSSIKSNQSGYSEDHELKKRWLLYCVALDKSIMYVNGVWNVMVPGILFLLVPYIHDTTHGQIFEHT